MDSVTARARQGTPRKAQEWTESTTAGRPESEPAPTGKAMTKYPARNVTEGEQDASCPGARKSEPVVLVVRGLAREHEEVLGQIIGKYQEVFLHEGYGKMQIEMRFLKRHQKEIIIHCGKDYRFVVDFGKEQSVT